MGVVIVFAFSMAHHANVNNAIKPLGPLPTTLLSRVPGSLNHELPDTASVRVRELISRT
jgi:hypothetical protein